VVRLKIRRRDVSRGLGFTWASRKAWCRTQREHENDGYCLRNNPSGLASVGRIVIGARHHRGWL